MVVLWGPGLSGKTTLAQRVGWRLPSREEASSQGEGALLIPRRILVHGHGADLAYGHRGRARILPPFDEPWQDPRFRDAAIRCCQVACGALFVADSQAARLNANVEQLKMLTRDLQYVGRDPRIFPVLFALNKRDLPNLMTVAQLRAGLQWPTSDYLETSGRSGLGINEALDRLLDLAMQVIAPAAHR